MRSALMVDSEDAHLLTDFTWHLTEWGYARTSVLQDDGSRRGILMHRMILDAREGQCVDHINGNKLDNRRSNLRIAPPHENRGPYKGRKFKGVYMETSGRWRSQAKFGNRTYYFGTFDTQIEAAIAYNAGVTCLGVPNARLNKVG